MQNISLQNAAYIEEMHKRYLEDPTQIDVEWQDFFRDISSRSPKKPEDILSSDFFNNSKVEAMINSFCRRGHLYAHVNPLQELPEIRRHLDLHNYDLDKVPANQMFYPANLTGVPKATLAEIVDVLERSYCGAIGVDFMEINNEERVVWIRQKMEKNLGRPQFNLDEKKRILQKLIAADGFEKFLHTRYLGQKRFSLEGCDVLIPMLDFLLTQAAQREVTEICIGMAHRGRLNVLTNFMQKSLEKIFLEFEGGVDSSFDIDGDVKYHLGFNSRIETDGKSIDLCLLPNPSHLEAINPVLSGYVRGRQRYINDTNGKKILPILIHGDASFSGQGVVFETLNLSSLDHYHTGGTVHIIINNQIGFTTDQCHARSMEYCSDIVKAIRAPVFHANADDPEAAAWTALLALAYRQKFSVDVVIDLVGYRRHGHNEGDEPAFTQPLMYQKINTHPRVIDIYGKQLLEEKAIDRQKLEVKKKNFRQKMETAYKAVKNKKTWSNKNSRSGEITEEAKTVVSKQKIISLAKKITQIPADFTLHPKIARIFSNRLQMCKGDGTIDWALAELLAIASLVDEGHHVRLSGQDCQRGTFSSRHAVVADVNTGDGWKIFATDKVEIINSPLSEFGALGFEFGYSIVDKKALVIWEAQFGDFANGAQVIIDQFLVASEAKWNQHSGLVLLLPHGYEGMGPEHSNARPERFLQLCGNFNIQVANPTTPAQYFHILRRQILRDRRKPLVIMSPKSLLRHPQMHSSISAFTQQSFQEMLDDDLVDADKIKKIIVCSGKIFYELAEKRAKFKIDDTALIRFEQLYPFPKKQYAQLRQKYQQAQEILWVQEEPQNMGAWNFIRPRLLAQMPKITLRYIGRKTSGTTAEGYIRAHGSAQKRIIDEALT